MTNTANVISFQCTPVRKVYDSENFKVYGCEVDEDLYPNIHLSEYGTCSIVGNFQKLSLYTEYMVWAVEKEDKRGISYNVKSINKKVPSSLEESEWFLEEFLSEKKTEILLEAYPDIIKRVIDGEPVDLSKTKGIKEKTFAKIKKKIVENFVFAELISEFKNVFSISTIRKLYDKYESVKSIKDAIKKDPYKCLCGVDNIGFKRADTLLLELYDKQKDSNDNSEDRVLSFDFDLRTSYQRMRACVEYNLLQNELSGNTYMYLNNLMDACEGLCPEAMHNFYKALNDRDFEYNQDFQIASRAYTYNVEKYIASRLLEGNKEKTIWNCNYARYRTLDKVPLTEQQCLTTEYVCKNNIVILNGPAGTGKSYSTKALINMLLDYRKSFVLFAPTGRAAKVLSAYTGIGASTIHRGLKFTPPDGWKYNKENKLDVDMVIVDEFSMVDIFLFEKLIDAIDFEKTKLLLIGDDAQLPSVGAGNILYDMLNSRIFPTITLDKVFRYGVGGLSTVATNTRLCKPYLFEKEKRVQVFGEDKAYVFSSVPQENAVDYAVNVYSKLLKHGNKPEDIIVLSAYNVGSYGTDVVNKRIQNIVNPDAKQYIEFGENQFRLNDIVLNTANNYRAVKYAEWMTNKYDYIDDFDDENEVEYEFIANGEIGRIVKIIDNSLVVDFDGLNIILDRSDLQNIKLGYAISVHKSQGGSFKYVIFITPRAHTFSLNSNLLYVGISRAKERCYHIGEIKTVNMALKKKENFDRKTMLQSFLKEF